jgi:GT2 family glycosyltransferase
LLDFSIVIPTYDRPDSLDRVLGALTVLEYPPDRFEVLVVDDGGEIPLESRVKAYSDSLNLLLLRQPNAGPGAARNHGAGLARGEYLAFTDDDCLPDPGWLRAMEAALRGSGYAICGGKTRNKMEGNPCSEATQLLADYLNEHYNPTRTFGAFFPTNNLSVSRKAFAELGGFDGSLRFGEDRDLCYRWATRGHGFVYAPDAVVYHAHRLTLLSFVRLHFLYGGGTYRFRSGCRKKGLSRPALSPALWYVNLVLSGYRAARGLRGVTLSALLAASQAATLAGMVYCALARPVQGE